MQNPPPFAQGRLKKMDKEVPCYLLMEPRSGVSQGRLEPCVRPPCAKGAVNAIDWGIVYAIILQD